MNLDKNLENKCRICAVDIFDNTSVYIFGDLYLEERIRKYLYITVSFIYYFIDFLPVSNRNN